MTTDGTLTGTPTTAGTYPITLTATNGVAPDATLNTSITVTGSGCTGSWCWPLSR
ncbi:hypothetical protein R3Q06_35255 [Rhodococcus erythropolis]|uniref:hypothetical protein n=1 Tax=Rhodococcus erythropolis TaxID=1833 RepID=UPI00294911C5|nr:hypothetical protein [Rhodococcus erythropolis]MDV6278642.1 hypothetical protein [Rhodococcus erythropolis]